MTGIHEMFSELDGRARYEVALEAVAALVNVTQRERWRLNKRRQRARGAGRDADRRSYAKRYATDAQFRERRKAYWREYDRKRREARKRTEGAA